MTVYNIIVAGVGGQGNLVCGHALAEAALSQGLRPVVGETFGASRRGGSVFTHLRITETIVGPLIPKGQANLIIGLEPIETLRAAVAFSNPSTTCLVSTQSIHTSATLSMKQKYPSREDIVEALNSLCGGRLVPIETYSFLEKIHATKALNIFMLGAVSTLDIHGLEKDNILKGIETAVGLTSLNMQAFDLGRQVMLSSSRE